MRTGIKSVSEGVAQGIIPCARGDSLLKSLTEARKFAGGFQAGLRNLFRRVRLQCFRRRFFWLVKVFEVR